MAKNRDNIWTISDVAEEFNISSRSIRFYEEKGLIIPSRTKGNQRYYKQPDIDRIKWILRGKRLGYSLNEISEMIGLANINMDEITQIQKGIEFGKKRLLDIKKSIEELKVFEKDLLRVEQKLSKRLAELE